MQTTLNMKFLNIAPILIQNNDNSDIQKTQSIRTAQMARGEEPCFRTEHSHDCATMCEWRRDCRKLKAVWRR